MLAAMTGLTVAWGGTALLLSPAARVLGDENRLLRAIISLAVLWSLTVAVLAIVLLWERQPLASLWLRRFRWTSIGWGLLLVVAHYAVFMPVGESIRRAAGLPGFAAGMAVALHGNAVYVLEYLHTPGDDRRQWLPRVRKVDAGGHVTTIATVNRPTR
jgi:hypothetical protein